MGCGNDRSGDHDRDRHGGSRQPPVTGVWGPTPAVLKNEHSETPLHGAGR
jgi:hypothetical protein